MKNFNYYESQLKNLNGDLQVKFISSDGETKRLNINTESIEVIIDFLEKRKLND